jgi:dihydroorotase
VTIFFDNFILVDEEIHKQGSVFCENKLILEVFYDNKEKDEQCRLNADIVLSGHGRFVLSPGFIDLHAHFRTPGFPEKETLESASIAAARGGWTTIVCMANTNPTIDNIELAKALKNRSNEINLIDLYPVISLTKKMEGLELSGFNPGVEPEYLPKLFSEDGKDIQDNKVFLAALCRATEAKIPVSCHCEAGGEPVAIRRALFCGKKTCCHIHIAHVSLAESCDILRETKRSMSGINITAEVTPHHIALTKKDAKILGEASHGKVAPPLGNESDRRAVIEALRDGTIDAIATDHAPHDFAGKEMGTPGFIGLETAFSVVNTVLVCQEGFSLSDISRFMSATPARILNLNDRGLIKPGFRADFCVLDVEENFTVESHFASRSKNSPFIGKKLHGKVLLTVFGGRITHSV